MNQVIDSILILLTLTGFVLLGSSRLAACIKAVGIQGALLGLLALVVQSGDLSITGVVLALIGATVKGILLPVLLFRAMREADTTREVEPLISFNLSVLAGALELAMSLWIGRHLRLPADPVSSFFVPAAIFTILAGLLVIVSRRKAITQVIGYLMLENGVYVFGTAVALRMPVLVELGILLDVFVGVFVMGIAVFHISRQFDHIDSLRLASLNDRV